MTDSTTNYTNTPAVLIAATQKAFAAARIRIADLERQLLEAQARIAQLKATLVNLQMDAQAKAAEAEFAATWRDRPPVVIRQAEEGGRE